ncbi:MAG: SRPBCC domain-containing protein [Bacteroidia bacterium]
MKKQKDFSYNFTVNASAKDAMKRIGQVDLWWAKKFKGKAAKLNDEFSVYFGGPKDTFVDFKISEVIPGEKIVWLVTDCNLHWIDDKTEWKHNEVIWNFTEKNGKTAVNFVHKGMTPESECYQTCKPGWTHHIKDSLISLIETGKGFPE